MSAKPHHISDPHDAARLRSIVFLNWAHGLDHFVLLIFPTVVIGLEAIYDRSYSELIPLSSAAFLAFGLFSLPAGWLADRWSRRNMMATFFFGCGGSLIATALAPNLMVLAVAMFALGTFAAIYHPVGMAMLIEASGAKGRTLAFNGVCGNLGVSLAAGVSGALAYWVSWRAAFLVPAAIALILGVIYVWLTPDDAHTASSRKKVAAVPLSPRLMTILFGLFIMIALTSGLVFNVLTIALPKIVDEGMAKDYSLSTVGGIATAVLICGAIAQLAVGRIVELIPAHVLFAIITVIGFLGNLWAVYASGLGLLAALAISVAAVYGQVTVNDMVMARYTADAWRGRIYAVRYFLLFVSAGAAIGLISLLHGDSGFGMVLAVNAFIALLMCISTFGLMWMVNGIEAAHTATQPAE